MNLFGAWKVGAPKVGAPSSHVTSLGLLFIEDTPHGFLLKFLAKIREKGCDKYKKKFGKIMRKNKGEFEWQKLKEGQCVNFLFWLKYKILSRCMLVFALIDIGKVILEFGFRLGSFI